MDEAVQFYWRTEKAALPFDAIPEGDRNPLRLRRSVVQTQAPAVIAQLEDGRFVCVVWPSGRDILMILCHPNRVKSGEDAILVNPTSSPRLIIKLGKWEEAPVLAGLFLKAFGDDAVTPEECATARADLAAWLASRAQPEMATITRHYSAFPFGARSDALEVINIWRKALIQGEKEAIDKFIAEVQRRFEALGWSRDNKREALFNRDERQVNRFYCWLDGWGQTPQFMLCLNRATDKRVRGETYDVFDHRVGVKDLANGILLVLGEVIEPSAATAGAKVTYPRLGPISRIGEKTSQVMGALAKAGAGAWPLPGNVEPMWRSFVQTAYAEGVAIKPEELKEWFNDNGWGAEASAELTNRFYADVELMAEYEEAGRQPA